MKPIEVEVSIPNQGNLLSLDDYADHLMVAAGLGSDEELSGIADEVYYDNPVTGNQLSITTRPN
jgi:hypothetical protein